MLQRLKLELRHKQIYFNNDIAQPVIVQCNVDGTAEYIPGTVPDATWQDFTEDVEGLDEFRVSWQASSGDDSSTANSIGSNYSKGVTLELKFIGAAFQFIYDWLMTIPCQSLNAVEARVTDMDCAKSYRTFELKLDNTVYRPNEEPCIVSMNLREKDDTIHNFQKTIIEDDWQKWFNETADSVKSHPTFLYIVEKKPKFFLTVLAVLAYIAGILSVGILIATTDGKRWIRKLLGICYFCPSPLIRTYIENICAKYGYTSDTIFDDVPGNKYRDVCMFYPVEKNYQEFDDYEADQTTFIWDNRTGLPFSKFLDQLKGVFNAEWYVTPNNKLVFKNKAYFYQQTAIYDFTTGSFSLYNLEYNFNGNKKPAYGNYSWQLDPMDACTNEIKWRYDTIVDFDGKANNPMLEGNVTKQFDFAMTAFNRDGTTEPYFEEAIKIGRLIAIGAVVVGLGEILAGTGGLTIFIAIGLISLGYAITNGFINDFFQAEELEGVIRTSNNQINVPRLVLWDRTSPMNAAKVESVVSPTANPQYNTTPTTYYQDHPTDDGSGFFGTDVMNIYNYKLYLDENFEDNLFDNFHAIDNPLLNANINQTWQGNVDLCCEMVDVFGGWDDSNAKIGAVVILEQRGTRQIKGRIESIEIDYKAGSINLKGNVLK